MSATTKLMLKVEKVIVSDFMVNSKLKILKGISVEFIKCLNEDAKKKEE